jgi:NAD(P)-dependent dehydrogenase (short-subunit alcohol dehydrogenase family)
MSDRLRNKVAIVTGGGGGIGGEIARTFAREGASVLVADISLERAEAVAASIREKGGAAAAYALDVSDPRQCEGAVKEAAARFGPVTTLLNGAVAVTPDANVENLALEDWEKALRINLTGYFLMCKYVIPSMRASGGGSIINIASSHGHYALHGRIGYCTTKAAIHHMTRVIALDYGHENIRSNSISPGPIDTERVLRRFGTREKSNQIRGPMQALGRTGTVVEVANTALFLASDESSFTTGADLRVDGGQTIWKARQPERA